MTIDDNFDNSDNCFCHFDIWKDNPGDLWHLRHWLQFLQLRTWIHDNHCYLTINCDTGRQHLQFLRCFFAIRSVSSNSPILTGTESPPEKLMQRMAPKTTLRIGKVNYLRLWRQKFRKGLLIEIQVRGTSVSNNWNICVWTRNLTSMTAIKPDTVTLKALGTYSLVGLVWQNTEELISWSFAGLYKIRLLLRECMRTKNVRN